MKCFIHWWSARLSAPLQPKCLRLWRRPHALPPYQHAISILLRKELAVRSLFVYEVNSIPFPAQLRSAVPRPPPVRDYAILQRSLGRRHRVLKPASVPEEEER